MTYSTTLITIYRNVGLRVPSERPTALPLLVTGCCVDQAFSHFRSCDFLVATCSLCCVAMLLCTVPLSVFPAIRPVLQLLIFVGSPVLFRASVMWPVFRGLLLNLRLIRQKINYILCYYYLPTMILLHHLLVIFWIKQMTCCLKGSLLPLHLEW
jgi:hypothetical protein